MFGGGAAKRVILTEEESEKQSIFLKARWALWIYNGSPGKDTNDRQEGREALS